MEREQISLRRELFVVVLALVSVVLLVIEIAGDVSPADAGFLQTVDIIIAVIFLIEWTTRLARATDRRAFVRKWWWELLAAIPVTTETTRMLRGLRLVRLLGLIRLLRLVRFATRLRVLSHHTSRFLGDSQLLSIATTVCLIVLAATLGFHSFEFGLNPHVHDLWDSFWWAMTTVTTVGYGDIYPTTTGGRLIAIGLMLTGIGTLGVFTATIARYVIRSHESET